MASISFDRAADSYDASRGYPPEVAEAIGAALFAAAGGRSGMRLLELGIGTGRIAIPLLARGADVTGVDIAPRMLARLRANLEARRAAEPGRPWGRLELVTADMTALPFPDAGFDAVVAVHVFHLVSEWLAALDEALRVLRPGGALLLGQDRRPGTTVSPIRARWVEIVRELGAPIGYIGSGPDGVAAELRARGLAIEETRPVAWTVRSTPRENLDEIAERVWSQTWRVPDDVFAASIARLRAWLDERYGPALDTPEEHRAEFGIARAIKPA
jgi:ubiquinone/menaquinone biosynthesis C-methylase UbiE